MELRADRSEVLRVLRFQFRHFLASPQAGPPSYRVALRLAGPRAALQVDGLSRTLPDGARATRHGLTLIFESMLDCVPDHLFFHAGVISSGDRGMLICGPPGFGKTSLVLELSRRGFGFLSDDYAPLALSGGLVAPFPRSVGIVAASRKATRGLQGVSPRNRLLYDGKWLLDPEGIPGLHLAGSCRPEVVLLLGPAAEAPGKTAPRYEISVDRERADELRRTLGEIPLRHRRGAGSPGERVFRFSLPQGKELSSQLEAWVYANRPFVFSMTRLFQRTGAFRPPLRIHPVAPRDGLLEMLGDLQNRRPASEGPGKARGSPARLLLQAAALLGRASFYRFEGGSLRARTEAAAEILRGALPPP